MRVDPQDMVLLTSIEDVEFLLDRHVVFIYN
jgi:hypothetical protein